MTNFNFNDVMKNVIVTGIGEFGPPGTAIGLLLDIFWPESQEDGPGAYALTEDDVQRIADDEIKEHIINDRLGTIKGFQRNLTDDYVHSTLAQDKYKALGYADNRMTELKDAIESDDDKYKVHMIQTTLLLAPLHLQVLRDRYLHGQELLLKYDTQARGKTDEEWKIQNNQWYEEIKTAVHEYQALLGTQFFAWRKWREEQIVADSNKIGTLGVVIDNAATPPKGYQFTSLQASQYYWQSTVIGTKNYLMSVAVAEKVKDLAPVFYYWNKFVNGKVQADDAPTFFWLKKTMWAPDQNDVPHNIVAIGPVNCATLGLRTDVRSDKFPVHKDNYKGEEIVGYRGHVHLTTSMESIQLKYKSHNGILYGGTGGHEVKDTIPHGTYINGVHVFLDEENNAVGGIRFDLSNGHKGKAVKATSNSGLSKHSFPIGSKLSDPMQFKLRKIDFNELDKSSNSPPGPNCMFFYFEIVPNITE